MNSLAINAVRSTEADRPEPGCFITGLKKPEQLCYKLEIETIDNKEVATCITNSMGSKSVIQ